MSQDGRRICRSSSDWQQGFDPFNNHADQFPNVCARAVNQLTVPVQGESAIAQAISAIFDFANNNTSQILLAQESLK